MIVYTSTALLPVSCIYFEEHLSANKTRAPSKVDSLISVCHVKNYVRLNETTCRVEFLYHFQHWQRFDLATALLLYSYMYVTKSMHSVLSSQEIPLYTTSKKINLKTDEFRRQLKNEHAAKPSQR